MSDIVLCTIIVGLLIIFVTILKPDNKVKIGFFETKPGERSLSALLSFAAFFAAVFFGYVTLKLPKDYLSIIDAGIWVTSVFVALCGGVKLGRSGIEMWKDVKISDSGLSQRETKTTTETKTSSPQE